MSVSRIEPEHLEEDEVYYELILRGMAVSQLARSNTKNLRECFLLESKGVSSAPKTYTASSVESEYSSCQQKYDRIVKYIEDNLTKLKLEEVLVLQSRLRHLRERIKRLQTADKSLYAQLSLLLDDINFALDRLAFLINRNKWPPHGVEQAAAVNVLEGEGDKDSQCSDVNVFWEKQVRDVLSSTSMKSNAQPTTSRPLGDIEKDFRNISLSPISSPNVNTLTNVASRGAIPKHSNPLDPILPIPSTTVVDNHPQGILRNSNISQPILQSTGDDSYTRYSDFIRSTRNQIPIEQNRINNPRESYQTNEFLNASLRLNAQSKNQHQQYGQYFPPQQNRVRFAPDLDPQEVNTLGTPLQNKNPSCYRRSPIASWGLNFSGNAGGHSLKDFLDKVDLYAQADGISSVDLLRSAVYLLSGSALTWFQAFGTSYRTWDELVSAMKSMFLDPDYDYELLQEINNRKQGQGESFGVYIANMEMLYRQLELIQVSEQLKLDTIIRNMNPNLAEKVVLMDITSIQQLARLCKKIESFNFKTAKAENPSQFNLLEPRFSLFKQQLPQQKEQVMAVENVRAKHLYPRPQYDTNYVPETFIPRKIVQRPVEERVAEEIQCWNCFEKGHDYTQCKQKKLRIFCYLCGEVGQVSRNCRNCEKNEQGGAVPANQHVQYRNPQF